MAEGIVVKVLLDLLDWNVHSDHFFGVSMLTCLA